MQLEASSKLTFPELVALLKEKSIPEEQVVKVLLLGNSGKGKSLLCNALARKGLFAHNFQATSLTDRNEYAVVFDEDGTAFVLHNIPGLLEVDQSNIQRNKSAIEDAFRHFPKASTVAVFVLGESGGRPCDDDIQAYRSLVEFVPALQSLATGFLLNRIDPDVFSAKNPRQKYEMALTSIIRSLTSQQMVVSFANKVPARILNNPNEEEVMCSEEMVQLHATVYNLLVKLKPAHLLPAQGAKLELDRDKLVKQIEELKKESKAAAERFDRQMKENAAAFDRKLSDEKKKHEEQAAAMTKEIEVLKKEPRTIVHNNYYYDDSGCAIC